MELFKQIRNTSAQQQNEQGDNDILQHQVAEALGLRTAFYDKQLFPQLKINWKHHQRSIQLGKNLQFKPFRLYVLAWI